MTLFAVSKAHESTPVWLRAEDGWRIHASGMKALVSLVDDKLAVKDESSEKMWAINVERQGGVG
jgi:hypothetical protein